MLLEQIGRHCLTSPFIILLRQIDFDGYVFKFSDKLAYDLLQATSVAFSVTEILLGQKDCPLIGNRFSVYLCWCKNPADADEFDILSRHEVLT
jgi:hypothetical protein